MISVCNDMEKVREFMLLPEITYYSAEHGAIIEDAMFYTNKQKGYLVYSVNGMEIGMIDFHIETGSMAMFHPYILREYKDYYDAMVQEFFQWFLKSVPDNIVKLNAIIPVVYLGALAAAEKAGMRLEGIDRMSYLSKGGPVDRAIVGITREELSA